MRYPEKTEGDFLGDEARRERRNVNIVAVLSILVVVLDLVPTQISALGVDLTRQDQTGVLLASLAFDLGFLVLFAVYALSDFVRWRETMRESSRQLAALEAQIFERREWIDERLRWYAAANEDERSGLSDQIAGQARKTASVVLRVRTVGALRGVGWVRFAADFILPLALGFSAAGLLIASL